MHMASQRLEPASAGITRQAGKYLAFNLQGESYGIDVLKVREIIRHTCVTAVPQMPSYIKGVINLRGRIIPVMDLRVRFACRQTNDTDQTCVIVVQVNVQEGKVMQMGLIVDGVEDVLNLTTEDIEETPDFGSAISTACIVGMAKVRDGVKMLLNVDRLLSANEQQSLGAAE